jgi:hypothetical protein
MRSIQSSALASLAAAALAAAPVACANHSSVGGSGEAAGGSSSASHGGNASVFGGSGGQGGSTEVQAFTHPGTPLTLSDLQTLKANIDQGKEPWKSAYALPCPRIG